MNITYCQEFIEVALNLSFSEAARKLHVSQSALSKHVAALEKECGVALFERDSSHVQLTNAGQALFEESFKLVRLHDEALRRVRSFVDTPQIVIGGLCEDPTPKSLIDAALAQANAQETVVSATCPQHPHQPLENLLAAGKIDVAITILDDPDHVDPQFKATFLFEDPMVCLVKGSHAFAQRDEVSITELGRKSILQPVGSYAVEHGRSTVGKIFKRYGISPIQRPYYVRTFAELSLPDDAGDMLIMEASLAQSRPFAEGYHLVRISEPDVAFSFYALTSAEPGKPQVADFVGHLAAQAEKLRLG